jgi:hypothetical protein
MDREMTQVRPGAKALRTRFTRQTIIIRAAMRMGVNKAALGGTSLYR